MLTGLLPNVQVSMFYLKLQGFSLFFIGVSSVTISVEWGVTDDDKDLDLYMRPAWINGTACETDDFDWDYLRADEEGLY